MEYVSISVEVFLMVCSMVYFEVLGMLDEGVGVGEYMDENEEYINMIVYKLFNGDCELEKMDCVDELGIFFCNNFRKNV